MALSLQARYGMMCRNLRGGALERLAFGIGVLLLFAAIPFLIFKFVVKATERDLVDAKAKGLSSGDSGHAPEDWLWGAVKCGAFFALSGPLIGSALVLFPIIFLTGGSLPGYLFMPIYAGPMALLIGGFGAFVSGFSYGLVMPRLSAGRNPPWFARIAFGLVFGSGGGLLVPTSMAFLGAAAGGFCALAIHGWLYRRIFQRPVILP